MEGGYFVVFFVTFVSPSDLSCPLWWLTSMVTYRTAVRLHVSVCAPAVFLISRWQNRANTISDSSSLELMEHEKVWPAALRFPPVNWQLGHYMAR